MSVVDTAEAQDLLANQQNSSMYFTYSPVQSDCKCVYLFKSSRKIRNNYEIVKNGTRNIYLDHKFH